MVDVVGGGSDGDDDDDDDEYGDSLSNPNNTINLSKLIV
jgi:hypothetical protein